MRKLMYIIPVLVLTLILSFATACGKAISTDETSDEEAEEEIAEEEEEEEAEEEVEATEFQGTKLTPIKDQLNNALAGTQVIDRDTYVLTVDGLVDNPLTLAYDQLLEYPQESWLMDLDCVEGWSFTAKWTGPQLNYIFNDAGVQPEAKIVIFYTADVSEGYSSLDLNYIRDNNIIIALKLNDVTLPYDRGFPFQVIAKEKFGYKWAKWVTRIELSSNTDFRGYWESVGYNNNADVEGPSYEQN